MAGTRQERRILFNAARYFTQESVATVFRPDVVLYESQVPGMPSYAVEISDALSRPRGDRVVTVFRVKEEMLLPVVRFYLDAKTSTIDGRFGLFVHRYQRGDSRLVTYYQINDNGSADLQAAAYYKFVEGGEKRVWGIRRGSKQFDTEIQHWRIPSSIDAAATVRMYLNGECQDERGATVPLTAKEIHHQPVIPFSGE